MSDTLTVEALPILAIAPAQLLRGTGILSQLPKYLSRYGNKALVIAGETANQVTASYFHNSDHEIIHAPAIANCSDENLAMLRRLVQQENPQVIVGIGGGKVLDTAKLVAHQCQLPIVTVPTTGATCAGWTALSNVYDAHGAFDYDVTLDHCPDMMFVDYDVIVTAPKRTLVSGIGDAIAKWYESSVSSGSSEKTMVIAAVQEARILRDILFQKSAEAIANPNSQAWREVVDASVCLAGAIGGLGGANCRTVAAHAIHNALTHLHQTHGTLHGEKVAYGILVQLRLEEFQGNQLAASSRHQLLKFYQEIGLPTTLADLGLSQVTLAELEHLAQIACQRNSDIHRLPFIVSPSQVLAAMVSTTSPILATI
ncbi:MAG: iron-containing alcohol dehydrogenase family protein [Pseudanabaena sp.]|jgi:glycerol dehydrogenase|nr:iron-containing alcohol dehydrogenase family protein [Pseudanabaena sp. M172S2SP2A07QC]MCA6517474.1 iron-containing alcohol dehydrogenase family protein [Pseudanabaena sp. M110S1SP2A07QC]MCA6532242.1 iron-containing alcohol dehydrogenase family protein [Pseudanabaena sp. M125S2SP2A07QC]MCA6533970.1 iron-containing alcohol dehydrogenase family protein [Pseudanabaena sp. M176S2SP2A07QC]MCA6541129.1 iron-containing alcohol dehydrogenase family protein [Pseudanabaena sp. M037S2SP2A07QC]MCA65440